MNHPRRLAVLLFSALLPAASPAYDTAPEPDTLVRRIAFGSCNSPYDETPVWRAVANVAPDVWIWLGDTIYADSPRPVAPTAEGRARIALDRMPVHYAAQNALPDYTALRARARVLGTWDDHDYGQNDAGAAFVGREEAQRHFLDFYGEPADSPRRVRPGVYASHRFGPPGRTVQVITLDTRSFRSALPRANIPRSEWVEGRPGTYEPVTDATTTLLGEEQWRWLEACLRQPADVRLLVSSLQVIADDHRFEKWGNFPHERRRLFQLIRDTRARGVVILSGDRHSGELSLLDPAREPDGAEIDPGYPLHDLTSSALTKSARTSATAETLPSPARFVTYRNELNRHRIGSRLPYNHFGVIEIDWDHAAGPRLVLSLRLDTGAEALRHSVPLASLRPPTR